MGRLRILGGVYFTFFIDTLGWAIVFPIFAPYFINQPNLTAPLATLGFFLMAFPLGQFFGAPILGELADQHGKKRVLSYSVLVTFFGMALTAWSFQINHLYLLFLSRLLTGFFSGNMSLCLACIADVSHTEREKARYFGYLSMFAGLSFIIGAFAGGKLADPEIVTWFNPAVPLWIATALGGFNVLCVASWMWRKPTPRQAHHPKVDWFESLHNVQKALQKNRLLYIIYFLFLSSWTLLFQFTPALVVEKFQFSTSEIGDLSLYMGLFWMVGSTYLGKWLLHRFSSIRILEICLFLFTAACIALTLPTHLWLSLAILGGCILLSGLAWPLCLGILSEAAPKESQGKILGISQSIQSLALTIAPVIGGAISQLSINAPFILGACASLLAGVIYYLSKGDH